jgi:GntR family transcriptional regulator, transcriptional repressor for pyruvate dehydrogenase complex
MYDFLQTKNMLTENRGVREATRMVNPKARTTLAAAALEQLISNVVNGAWKAGDLIPQERELCQQFGIARTSLREALKAMELIGMLESRVGQGTFICPRSEFLSRPLLWAFTGTDHTELGELLEARVLLERDLAGLAAKRASEEELLASNTSVLESDMAFHFAVAKAAHNEVLAIAAQLLRNLMKDWIQLKLLINTVPTASLKRHQAIYNALHSRNGEAARHLMWEHLNETSELIMQITAGRSQRPDEDAV